MFGIIEFLVDKKNVGFKPIFEEFGFGIQSSIISLLDYF